MQAAGISAGPASRTFDMMDMKLHAFLASGLLASLVLLAGSSAPPAVSVSELMALGEDTSVTVYGILVSLRSYESGSEVLVLTSQAGEATVKVVCAPGPSAPPSAYVSIGDMIEVSGDCAFEDTMPTIYCPFGSVRVAHPSEDVVTVSMVSVSWHLLEGDRFCISGVCKFVDGSPRLFDESGCVSASMRLDRGVEAVEGKVAVDCTLVMDASVLALVLEVHQVIPRP